MALIAVFPISALSLSDFQLEGFVNFVYHLSQLRKIEDQNAGSTHLFINLYFS